MIDALIGQSLSTENKADETQVAEPTPAPPQKVDDENTEAQQELLTSLINVLTGRSLETEKEQPKASVAKQDHAQAVPRSLHDLLTRMFDVSESEKEQKSRPEPHVEASKQDPATTPSHATTVPDVDDQDEQVDPYVRLIRSLMNQYVD